MLEYNRGATDTYSLVRGTCFCLLFKRRASNILTADVTRAVRAARWCTLLMSRIELLHPKLAGAVFSTSLEGYLAPSKS